MKLLAVLSLSVALSMARHHHQIVPRRLDTTRIQFVDQDDIKFNDQLAEEFQLEKLGDHGFLVDKNLHNQGLPKVVEYEDAKAFVKSIEDDGELAEKTMEHEKDAIDAFQNEEKPDYRKALKKKEDD